MRCKVLARRIDRSGHFVLADNVSPDDAARIISAQPNTPGYVIWRVDYV